MPPKISSPSTTASSNDEQSNTNSTTTNTSSTTTNFEIPPTLAIYISNKVLDKKAEETLINLYLDGNKEERMALTKMFPQAFRVPDFVQSLIKAGTIRVAQIIEKEFDPTRNNITNNFTSAAPTTSMKNCFASMKDDDDGNQQEKKTTLPERRERNSGNDGEENNNNNEQDNNNTRITIKRDLQQRCRTLRKAIDEAVCSVTGSGPHKIRFGVVKTQADCEKIISIFNQQFVYPGVRELRQTYVKPPQKVSTRHRSIRTGNFCWFLQYVKTGEICCAASVNIHPMVAGYDDRIVFEVPLYATAAGFKHLGLARILNAAIQELAIFMKAELVLISADQNAIPFWTNKNLGGGGYSPLSRGQKDSIQFVYDNMCQLFGDVTLLGWKPPRGADALASGLMEDALTKTPKFIVDGPARLPLV